MGDGFRSFAVGEVLTAANVNGYLQEQAVMSFASAAARDAAITSPEESMHAYLRDTNMVSFYDGTAWVLRSAQLIQKVTLSATGTITLTPIAGFSKLVIRYSARGTNASNTESLRCYIDGDTTATNYHTQVIEGSDGAAGAAEGAIPEVAIIPGDTALANSFGTGEVQIINYNEASRIKVMTSSFTSLLVADFITAGMRGVAHDAGATDAISTSLVLDGGAADLASGSWAELWGY